MAEANNYKIPHGVQQQIKQWLAEGNSQAETTRLLQSHYGISLNSSTMCYYAAHYKKEILEMRKEICKDVMAVPISQPAIRQQRREKIYHIYIQNQRYDLAREILLEAKKELESVTEELPGAVGRNADFTARLAHLTVNPS